jgi:hypothetical protein
MLWSVHAVEPHAVVCVCRRAVSLSYSIITMLTFLYSTKAIFILQKDLSVRRTAKFRRGGNCWTRGCAMVGGCNDKAGHKRLLP